MRNEVRAAFNLSTYQKYFITGAIAAPFIALGYNQLDILSTQDVANTFAVSAVLAPLYTAAFAAYNFFKNHNEPKQESSLEQEVGLNKLEAKVGSG